MPRKKKVSKQVEVSVQKDHLRKLSKARRPLQAIQELIWNSLDADATRVEVAFDKNLFGGIERVSVIDDGEGFTPQRAFEVFERLGGSWKQEVEATAKGRRLHGKEGKGRFAAFALGPEVAWTSVTQDEDGNLHSCTVETTEAKIDRFQITGLAPRGEVALGTTVTVSEIPESVHGLVGADAAAAMLDKFALYLVNYPGVTLVYDGQTLDPKSIIAATQASEVEVEVGGETLSVALEIVEWSKKGSRGIFLGSADGFALGELPLGVNTQNRRFTLHLRGAAIEALHAEGALSLGDLHPGVRALVHAAREELIDYQDKTSPRATAARVKAWRKQGVYPFPELKKGAKPSLQQRAFDLLANEAEERAPELRKPKSKSKRLLFQLLAGALEGGPEPVETLFAEAFELNEAQRKQLGKQLSR